MVLVFDVSMVHRPTRIAVVVGTGTEVGKTWVSAEVLGSLRTAGLKVSARKLAQSHEATDDPAGFDAAVLARATGEDPEIVCPAALTFPVAMAPPMAAEALGVQPPTIAELCDMAPWIEGVDMALIETAGGLRSPQAADGDCLDVIGVVKPDLVVLVADAGLGTISTVRLCVDALRANAPTLEIVVVLNRFDSTSDLHRRNRHWLKSIDGFEIFCTPEEVPSLSERLQGETPQA